MGAEEELKAVLVGKLGKREARRFERYIPNLTKAGYSDADSLKNADEETLSKLGLPSYLAEKLAGAKPRANGGGVVLKYMLLPVLIGFGVMGLGIHFLKNYIERSASPIVSFLNAPQLKDLPEFSPGYLNDMLWGTYRSGLYFGLKTRQPKPMAAGLLWFNPEQPEEILGNGSVRHDARQGDNLATYGWVKHDGRSFGEQIIEDGPYRITLYWVKSVSASSGPGGDWAVRVKVDILKTATDPKPKQISLVMYLVDEDSPVDDWILFPEGSSKVDNMKQGAYLIAGNSNTLGHWALHAHTTTSARVNYTVLGLPGDLPTHKMKELVLYLMAQTAQEKKSLAELSIPDYYTRGTNASVFQITMTAPGTAELQFLTNLEDGGDERLSELKDEELTKEIRHRAEAYDKHLEEEFLGKAGKKLDELTKKVVSAALSNLVGSMGYFYGDSLVQMPGKIKMVKPYGPCALYTCVPSRSFFPRGFLWDEGFHQLLLQRLDPQLSRDVLAHWLDLINKQGWIPREQILGEEARARVDAEYIVQHPTHANPPSPFLALARMAETLEDPEGVAPADAEANRQFLQMAWPRLEAWFGWYLRTQQGPMEYTYRWHGRNETTTLEMNPRTLMSGLDDYPRASHPSDIEMHLDLRCWLALGARTMHIIGTALNLPEESVALYRTLTAKLSDVSMLNRMHMDQRSGMYLDFGNHTEHVRMEKLTTFQLDGQTQETLIRIVDKPPQPQLVPNFGYVSLFPLFMQLLPPGSSELASQLRLLADTSLLYSPHGLRSLATTSNAYRKYNTATDPPYWRGAVWINMNYLALRSLHYYCQQEGPSQARACELHDELRVLVLGNVVRQYEKTGYLWEQYDDVTGEGKGSRPFTGWTALVALIAAEAY